VGGLPWTEIDFVEDLRQAEVETLPQIDRLQGKP
jgi:choline kinase